MDGCPKCDAGDWLSGRRAPRLRRSVAHGLAWWLLVFGAMSYAGYRWYVAGLLDLRQSLAVAALASVTAGVSSCLATRARLHYGHAPDGRQFLLRTAGAFAALYAGAALLAWLLILLL